MKPIFGPWIKVPDNRKAFNVAMTKWVKAFATHVCKKCDEFAIAGWGWKSPMICNNCGKTMSKNAK